MNKVFISGMVGKDPVIHELSSGIKKAEFSVANKVWKNNGAKTVWVQVRTIGKRAEAIEANLKKGMKVWVEGSWDADEWKDKTTQLNRRLDYVFASSIEWDSRGASNVTRDNDRDMSRDESHGNDDDDAY